MSKRLNQLNPHPQNPRSITDKKLEMLKKSLAEYGDLSGFVYNLKTKHLVGGHQRMRAMPDDCEIKITKAYDKPTRVGTLNQGYLLYRGERYSYREVHWDEMKEKAANIAANKGAGDWDWGTLAVWMKELNALEYDLDLTMFGEDELGDLLKATPHFEPGEKDDQSPLDQKKRVECPDCGNLFVPGWK